MRPHVLSLLSVVSLTGCIEATPDEALEAPGPNASSFVTERAEALAGPSVRITFIGGGAGEVTVTDETTFTQLATCTASCTVAVTAAHQLRLTATTPSVFAGLTGACTSAGSQSCTFAAGGGRSNVTLTLNRAPGEVWTRFLAGGAARSAAFDRENALIVATATNITKLSATGAVSWEVPIVACSLATGPNNTVYAQTATTLVKLKASGATQWSVPLDPRAVGCTTDDYHFDGFNHSLAVGRDGAVAVSGHTGVARWDTNGVLTWSAALTGSKQQVAIDPQGRVAAGVESESVEPVDLRWFTPAGAPLPSQDNVSPQYAGMIAIDPVGRLLTSSSGHSHTALRVGGVEIDDVDIADSDYAPNGVAAASSDFLWLTETDDDSSFVRTWTLRRYHANGSLASTFTASHAEDDFYELGTNPHDLAGSLDGRAAVIGELNGREFATGFVTVFDP